jgi:hypothetical protein
MKLCPFRRGDEERSGGGRLGWPRHGVPLPGAQARLRDTREFPSLRTPPPAMPDPCDGNQRVLPTDALEAVPPKELFMRRCGAQQRRMPTTQ